MMSKKSLKSSDPKGVICNDCGKKQLLPKIVCRFCGSDKIAETSLHLDGSIETFTIIRIPPLARQDEAPYAIVLVRTVDDVLITGRLQEELDASSEETDIEMGAAVEFLKEEEGVFWFQRKITP